MRIEPVPKVESVLGAWNVEPAKEAGANGASFSNILSDAIHNTVEAENSNAVDTMALLSGADTEIHTSMIETQKAELALNLTIQVRNKVLDAYNEVMRMQV